MLVRLKHEGPFLEGGNDWYTTQRMLQEAGVSAQGNLGIFHVWKVARMPRDIPSAGVEWEEFTEEDFHEFRREHAPHPDCRSGHDL